MRNLPDVRQQLKKIEADLREIKERQAVGLSSLVGYRTASDNDNDLEVTTTAPITRYRVTFDYATATGKALIDFKPFFSVTTPVVADDSNIDIGSGNWDVFSELENIENTYTTFILAIYHKNAPTPQTGWLKFIFDGSDTGTWSIASI